MELEDVEKQLQEEARLREAALMSGGGSGLVQRPPAPFSAPPALPPLHLRHPPPPPLQAKGRSSVSAAAAASLFSAGMGSGTPNTQLVEVILEQQRLLEQAGVRRAQVQPGPQFQVFEQQAHFQKPPPVNTSPSVLLGAQMAQLHLDSNRTLNRVDVLQANQMAMQANQLGMLRKQQLAAADLKVVFVFCRFLVIFLVCSAKVCLSLALY